MDEIAKELARIGRAVERQGDIAQKALDSTPKPPGRFTRLMELVVLIAGAMGILNSVDLVMRWVAVTGG